MQINYKPVGWNTTKFVNPTNMNQMDAGIKAACDGVDSLIVEVLNIGESTDVSEQSYGGYTYNFETGYVNSLQPMIYNAVVEVLGRLSTDIGQLAIAHNEVNESLGKLNDLETTRAEYTSLTLDGVTYTDITVTIKSIMLTAGNRPIEIGVVETTNNGDIWGKCVDTQRPIVRRKIGENWSAWETLALNIDLATKYTAVDVTNGDYVAGGYGKIGKMVTVNVRVKANSTTMQITKLPACAETSVNIVGAFLCDISNDVATPNAYGYLQSQGTIQCKNLVVGTTYSVNCTYICA